MEENKIPAEGAEMKVPKGKFLTWLDNFWYHYKWHSIVALILIVTITVCTLQMCQRVDYDMYIVYAGGKQISKTSSDGGYTEIEELYSSFKSVTDDFDENGKTDISVLDLFMLSSDEFRDATGAEADTDTEVNYSLLQSNNETFRELMMQSNYYLMFLSDTLYQEYAKSESGSSAFASLLSYAEGRELDFLDDGAIYLHSSNLGFANLPGIRELPENTVICIRELNAASLFFSKSKSEELFRRAETVLGEILATYTQG